MQLKKVRLTLNTTRFVSSEAEFDEDKPGKMLVLPAVSFRKAVALAETTGFRAPRGSFMPSHTVEFARALKEAMSRKAKIVAGPRGSSGISAEGQLRDFFAQPAQARLLKRLLEFVVDGGSLDVSDA
ncbi:hypothetical protein [Urbifossiella limnaea]|uniref:Uncharacterized protein n=1 Tax=Urbifossiella limnaea TaxID=2528023 RepID=A0A517XSW2_9BACT|nr:hypothetical protein [Urbifossiella limnaea]QDU20572.1 hypothetical protein ETAA1_25270 [Urbifossiella limnaea]